MPRLPQLFLRKRSASTTAPRTGTQGTLGTTSPQVRFALGPGHLSTLLWAGGGQHGPDQVEGFLPATGVQWGNPTPRAYTQMPFECVNVLGRPRGYLFMLLKQCNKFLCLSVALHSALFKPTGALRPLRKPTNFGGASAGLSAF